VAEKYNKMIGMLQVDLLTLRSHSNPMMIWPRMVPTVSEFETRVETSEV